MKFDGNKQIEMVAIKESVSSNGVTIYTTCKWADDSLSCNCLGWANSKHTPKVCRHTKESVKYDYRDMQPPDQLRSARMPVMPLKQTSTNHVRKLRAIATT